jgi:hypothetical protein
VAAAFMVAGCASSGSQMSGDSAPPSSSTAGAPQSSTASPQGSSSAAATVATPAAPDGTATTPMGSAAACTATQLKIQYTDNSQIKNGDLAGMSKADQVVEIINEGSQACETGGYPGVAALNSAGEQIMQAARTPGAGTVITLQPGAAASALVSANTASCNSLTSVAGLLVTAPNQRTSVRLGQAGDFCLNSLQVGALKPGNAAGLNL